MSPLLTLFLLIGALALLGWLYAMLRQRGPMSRPSDDEALIEILGLNSANEALLVASEHGRLLHINETARRWLNVSEGEPNIEFLAGLAQPSDSFLDLLSRESQASFQIAGRWVEATSHRIPAGGEVRMVIVMRPLSDAGASENYDLSSALNIVSAAGETVQVGMSVEEVLQTLLTIVTRYLPASAGEICLYDAASEQLTPRGWLGGSNYVLALAETGGVYNLGEGITGWMAKHRKPVLITDISDPQSLRPRLADQPFHSFVGVPLLVGDQLIGTFELAQTQTNGFNQGHLALLQTIARPLATTIYTAQQYAEQVQRIETLAILPEQALGVTDQAAMFQALTERIAQLIGVDIAGVLLYDEQVGALVAQEPFYGLPTPVVRNFSIPLPPNSESRAIFERAMFWKSADLVDEPLAEAMRLDTLVNAAGVRDIMLMPMQLGSRRIGMLQVSNRRAPGGFNVRDEQNLRLLAAQAAIVVEELRLFEQDVLRESEMMSLQEITQAFGALAHDGDALEDANARIARLMNVEKCGVLLYDANESALRAQLPIFGLDDELARHYRIPLEPNSVVWHMWQQQDFWHTNDVSVDKIAVGAGLADFAELVGVQKTMVVPLLSGGRRFGVLQISNKINGDDFNDKDARVLTIFAAQVAAHLENTRLFREARQRANEADTLRRISDLAGKVLTVDDSFASALAEVAKLLDSPVAFITIIDNQTGNLVTYPRNVYGDHKLTEPVVQDAFSHGYEHSVFMSRQPFLSNDTSNDSRVLPVYREGIEKGGVERVMLVPLAVGKTGLGELGVANRASAYEPSDLQLLETIAPQIAAALDRQRLYDVTGQNLSRRIRELDAISRVTNELTQTLDVERVLEIVCLETQRVTEADGVTVVLFEATDDATPVFKLARRVGQELGTDVASIEQEAALRGADSVVIADYAEPGDLLLVPRPENAHSAAAAAILYEERVVGVLHIFHEQPRRFDSQVGSFLQTMATKAALGYGNNLRYLENQERSTNLRRRVDQLNRIFEIGQIFQHNADVSTLLEAIAFSIQQSVGFDVVLLALREPGTDILRRAAQAGMPIEAFERSVDYEITVQALEAHLQSKYQVGESYFLPFERVGDWGFRELTALSMTYDGKRTMHPRAKDDWRDGDMLLVPLRGVAGEMVGMISLDRPFSGKRPDRSTIDILEIFAHQTTTSLENARLFADSEQNAQQQGWLNEILEAIAGSLNPNEILHAIAQGVHRLLPFQRMTFAMQDPDTGGFMIARFSPDEDGELALKRERRADLARTALGRAFQTRQDALYKVSAEETSEFEDVRTWRAELEAASLIVPLMSAGQALGVLHLGSDARQANTLETLRPVIRRVANLAAVALQNARLFTQAVNLRSYNESIVQSIQQGIVVLDKSGLIMTVNEYMRRRYGWDNNALRQDLFAFRPELKAILAEPVRRVIEAAEPQELLEQRIPEGAESRIENLYLYPLLVGDGVRGVVLLVEDITEHYQLERDLETRASQLAALTDASSQLVASLDREAVINVMFDAMQRVLPYDTMALWRRDGDALYLEAARGGTPQAPGTRVDIGGDEHLQQIMDTHRTLSVTVNNGTQPPLNAASGQSWLGVPLMQQGSVTGVIALAKDQPDYYDAIAEQAGLAFANQVVVALQNATLFDETTTQMERLSLINRVSMALAQSLDTENILEIALREIALLLGGSKGHAYVFERELHLARVIVDYPRGEEQPSQTYHVNDNAALRHAFSSPAPLIINDVHELPHDHPLFAEMTERGLAAYMLVPLLVGGQTGGMFEIEYYKLPGGVDAAKVDLALLIANQASFALLNANLLEQTMIRTRELETLLEAAHATSFTLDLDEVFQSVVRLTVQALDMDDCLLLLYDNIEEELEVMVDFNRSGTREEMTEPKTTFSLFEYPTKRRAMQDLQVIIIRYDATSDLVETEDMRAKGVVTRIFVPLKARDEGIGLLQIDSLTPHRLFTHRESRMAQALGAQAAIAIENARLSTETANQVAQSLVINDLSRAISSTMDIDVMIRIIREQVPYLTDAQDVYVALYDTRTNTISFPMAARRGVEYVIEPRRLGSDEVSFIIKNRRPLPLGGEHPSIDEVRRNLGIVNGEGEAKRYLGVPLIAGDQVVGVLAVRDEIESRPFGLNDQRILTTIGTQLGATIQNAQLFAEINERVRERTFELQLERDRLDTLYRVTSELVSTQQDMNAALNRALALTTETVGADEGLLLLYDVGIERLYCDASTSEAVDPAAKAKHPADMFGDWVMQQRQAVMVDDLHRVPYWNENLSVDADWRSAVGAPLGAPEDEKGVAIFLSRKPAIFGEAQLKLVSAAAYQIGSALKDAELVTLIKDQNEQLNLLLRSEREERGKSAAILQSIADGVVVVDANDRIMLLNEAAERILETARQQVEHKTLPRVAKAIIKTNAEWAAALDRWVAEARLHGGKLSIERFNLGERVINVQLSPVMIGESLGTVAVFRDITRDVEVERMKGQFIANVSHELRTPLTSIKGYADLMTMGVGGSMNDQQSRFVTTIRENTERMVGLVNDLLLISTIDSGGETLALETIPLAAIITEVLETAAATSDYAVKQIDVKTQIDPALPEIRADRDKLRQILANVVENAYSYTPSQGKIEVVAGVQPDNEHVLISVKDTGIGIPEEFQERVWNRFERYEQNALVMAVSGTGLGLPIARQYVEMHGGRIWFESVPNKGTTFYIELPIHFGGQGQPERIETQTTES
ncbi:MAG: GAF domain-containing protein [Anaerolineae bacterium]|nr:GAF domain-containing protein [Anaerolineae bacterium]